MNELEHRGGEAGDIGHGGETAIAPGKSTLTAGFGPGPTRSDARDATARLEANLELIESSTVRLEAAIGALDFDAAASSSAFLASCLTTLDSVDGQAAGDAEGLGSQLAGAAARVPTIAARARAAIARAPAPDPGDGRISAAAMGPDESPERMARKQRWLDKLGASDGGGAREHAASQPLQGALRSKVESATGSDLSSVRVNTGPAAAAVADAHAARAVAIDQTIHVGSGEDLQSPRGEHLIAHEVAHTLQAQQGGRQPTRAAAKPRTTTAPESAAEVEADRFADAITEGRRPAPIAEALDGAVARKPSGGGDQPVNSVQAAREFFTEYGLPIYGHLANHETVAKGLIRFIGHPPYADISTEQLVTVVFTKLFSNPAQMWQTLVTLFGEQELAIMVFQGRDDKTSFYLAKDPVVWQSMVLPQWDHVADDLGARMMPFISDSLTRLAPRYAYLRTSLQRIEYRTHREKYDPEGRLPYVWEVPQVDPALLTPAHPIDRAVIAAMVTRNLVTPHFDEVFRDFPQVDYDTPNQAKGLRPVRVLFENAFAKNGMGLSTWMTIAEPGDASIEEVANTIYGDPSQAYLLVKAGRWIGFPLGKPFTKQIQEQYFKTYGQVDDQVLRDEKLNFQGPQPDGVISVDPVREILAKPGAGDYAIKAQAAGLKAIEPSSAEAVLQRYSFIINDLTKLDALLPSLPFYKATVKPVLERTRARADQIKNGDHDKAAELDVPSLLQQQVTSASATALDHLVVAYQKFTGSLKPGDKYGDAFYDSQRPYQKVAGLYIDAVAASELPQTGPDRLAIAQRAAETMPIEILEAMLSGVRQMLLGAHATLYNPMGNYQGDDYDLHGMEVLEQDCRSRLQAAREYVATDPSKLYPIIEYVQAKIFELQVTATVLSGMEECNELIHELESRLTKLGSVTGKNTDYRAQVGKLNAFVQRWDGVYDLYRTFKNAPADAKKPIGEMLRTAFDMLRNDEQWKGQYAIVQKLIDDGETFEKWVRIGLMVGIAVATMGAGTVASGVAAGFELGAVATGVTVTGVEAFTFTTLSRMVNENPANKGYLEELKENFVTFGVFRALSAGYRGVIGASAASSAGGVVTELVGFQLAQTVQAVHQANEESRQKYGRDLTSDEMDAIISENLVVAGATALIGFAGARQLKGIEKAGKKIGGGIAGKVSAIDTTDATTVQLATAAKLSKHAADLQLALANERHALDQRKALLADLTKTPERAAAAEKEAGMEPGTLTKMAEEVGQRLAENKTAADMLELESAGGDQFLYPSGEHGEKVDAFLKRQKEELGGDWKPLEADPYTGARRFRVTPKEGPPFTVTEKLAGMGHVIGGVDRGKPEPHSGRPAGEADVGGTKGRDVYRVPVSDPAKKGKAGGVDPSRVRKAVQDMAGISLAHGASLSVKKGSADTVHLAVPQVADPKTPPTKVKVKINVSGPDDPMWSATAGAGPHGGDEGPARLSSLTEQPDGTWTAEVLVNSGLRSEDVVLTVQHELNEVSDILAHNPKASEAEIAAQTRAGVFQRGTPETTVTAHDRAAARELASMHEDLVRERDAHKPNSDAIGDKQARLDRMIESMGLDDAGRITAEQKAALAEAGVPAEVRQDLYEGGPAKRRAANFDRAVDTFREGKPMMSASGGRTAAGHGRSKHWDTSAKRDVVRDILNRPARIFTGRYERSGRAVDIYCAHDSVVITEAGQKDVVVTAYGPAIDGPTGDKVDPLKWAVDTEYREITR